MITEAKRPLLVKVLSKFYCNETIESLQPLPQLSLGFFKPVKQCPIYVATFGKYHCVKECLSCAPDEGKYQV